MSDYSTMRHAVSTSEGETYYWVEIEDRFWLGLSRLPESKEEEDEARSIAKGKSNKHGTQTMPMLIHDRLLRMYPNQTFDIVD